MKRILTGLLLSVAVSACGAPRAVPASREPRHHLVYSNEIAHVLDVRVGAMDTTLYHVHAYPLVGVRLRAARSWDQTLGQPPGKVDSADAVPEELDNWSRTLPYTHRVGVADTVGFHLIIAEVLKPSGVTCDSLPDSPTRKLVKSSPTAFVYALTLAPDATEPTHSHACPGLIVQGTDGAVTMVGPTLPVASGGAAEGAWSWHAPGYAHSVKNTGPTTVTIYEIEIR